MTASGARGYLARARSLTQRAEALGAALASWSALNFAFAFEPDAIEEVIDLVTHAHEGDDAEAEKWAFGIAQGEVEALGETGLRGDLIWGEPLVIALTLSRVARSGEVLMHASVRAALVGLLNTKEPRAATENGIEVLGVPLDLEQPWKRLPGGRIPSTRSMRAVRSPPAPPVTAGVPLPLPTASPDSLVARAAAAAAAAGAAATGESSLVAHVVPPAVAAAAALAPPKVSSVSASASPSPAIVRPPSSLPARGPSMVDDEEVDPEALAARLAQLTREALIVGDAHALERWADGLKATGEKDGFAERMRAMARLSKGRVGDALARLQRVRREAETGAPAQRCQAALALAVGYAFAGRSDEALLEALDALARAREGNDQAATRACMALLAKLFARQGRGAEAASLLAGAMH